MQHVFWMAVTGRNCTHPRFLVGATQHPAQDFKARLAGSAHSLYYVDLIGNISTSNVRKRADEVLITKENTGSSLPLQR
jgi:hypothetical protein